MKLTYVIVTRYCVHAFNLAWLLLMFSADEMSERLNLLQECGVSAVDLFVFSLSSARS